MQLEVRAGSVMSLDQLQDTVRSWLAQLQNDANHKGYRYPEEGSDNSRSLSFTQVLLRSSCVEELLACVVCNPTVRADLISAWATIKDESPDSTPSSERTHANSDLSVGQLAASSLYQLLTKTLTGEESVWFDIVSILFSPHGHDETYVPEDRMEEDVKIRERANSSADWVARCERIGFRAVELQLVRSLKRDWYMDWLEAERRELATLVDSKKNQMINRTSSGEFPDTNGALWQKVSLSGDLVDLYEQIKDNLDTCAMHRTEEKKALLTALDVQSSEVEKLRILAESEQVKSLDRQTGIRLNADETEVEYKPKLEAILEQRVGIDERIKSLESEKLRLKIELERVSAALVTAQTEQRVNMETEDRTRGELNSSRIKFETMLESEQAEESESKLDASLNGRCLGSIQNTKDRVGAYFSEKGNELNDIYTQFDNAFIEAVQDHITVLCESIQEIYRQCKKIGDDLETTKKSKTAQSMSQVLNAALNEFEKEEFSASLERLNIRTVELEGKLGEEAKEVKKFAEVFAEFFKRFETKLTSNRLLKGEVDKVKVVLGEADKILNKYAMVSTTTVAPPTVADTLIEEDISDEEGVMNA